MVQENMLHYCFVLTVIHFLIWFQEETRLGIYAILHHNFGRCLCQFMCSCNVYKNVFKKTLNEAMKVKLELQWNLQNAIVSEPWNIHKARKQAWTRPSLWAMLTGINKCEKWNYPRPLTQSITILNPLNGAAVFFSCWILSLLWCKHLLLCPLFQFLHHKEWTYLCMLCHCILQICNLSFYCTVANS